MDIKEAIERRDSLKARRARLVETISKFNAGIRFDARLRGYAVSHYAGDIDDVSFTKDEVFSFLQREVDQIDAELAKMKPVFETANLALKSIFPDS